MSFETLLRRWLELDRHCFFDTDPPAHVERLQAETRAALVEARAFRAAARRGSDVVFDTDGKQLSVGWRHDEVRTLTIRTDERSEYDIAIVLQPNQTLMLAAGEAVPPDAIPLYPPPNMKDGLPTQ